MKLQILICLISFSGLSYSQDFRLDDINVNTEDPSRVDHKRHHMFQRVDQESLVRVEKISQEKIEKKSALTLSDAVAGEVGVDTQMTCGNCGSKRITLNGLRGEHTTVMVDGMPLHSAVSSFYGMDAVPVIGILGIDILRGPGASLTSPEAIGGVINVETVRAQEDMVKGEVKYGEIGLRDYQLLATKMYNEGKIGLAVGAQLSSQGGFDVDHNSVSENPDMDNFGYFAKINHKLNDKIDYGIRFSSQKLELLGGTTTGFRPRTFPSIVATETDFENGDVRRNFVGTQDKIADLIEIEREEIAGSIDYHLSHDTSIKFSVGVAKQSQDSLYMHAFDYSSNDVLSFYDLKFTKQKGHHVFTYGVDFKHHSLKSDSLKLYDMRNLQRDNFEHEIVGLYFRDEWFLTNNLELSFATRLDYITVDWTEYTEAKNEIDEYNFSPRLNLLYRHNNQFTSRLSSGVGYRAPLTLYESQHGSDHDGFEIEIRNIEKAIGASYSLDYRNNTWMSGLSLNYTKVKNLSYAEDRTSAGLPLLFKNLEKDVEVFNFDVNVTKEVNHAWVMSLTYEQSFFGDTFASTLPVAATEKRVTLLSDVHLGDKVEWLTTFAYTFSRSLSRYGYDSHYNVYDGTNVSDQKRQKAPGFLVVDTVMSYALTSSLDLKLGVLNIFDYTQTSDGDSPLTWDLHAPGDVHLDNFHLWGPIRGRQIYAGVNFLF